MLEKIAISMANKEIKKAKNKKASAKKHPLIYITGVGFGTYFFYKGLSASVVELLEKIIDKKEESDKKIEEKKEEEKQDK